jgi:hypothetical protein
MKFGSPVSQLGFNPAYGRDITNFAPYLPQNDVSPSDVLLFTPTTATNFVFSSRKIPITQTYFARQFAMLAKVRGCSLLALHLPLYGERKSEAIKETRNWRDLTQTDMGMMGIPPGRFFANISDEEIEKLYFDPGHLNENGQRYFTTLITPALINYYEQGTPH